MRRAASLEQIKAAAKNRKKAALDVCGRLSEESEVEFYKCGSVQRTWLAPVKFYKCALMHERARGKSEEERGSRGHSGCV